MTTSTARAALVGSAIVKIAAAAAYSPTAILKPFAELRAQPAIRAARAELTRSCSNNALGLHGCMFRIGD